MLCPRRRRPWSGVLRASRRGALITPAHDHGDLMIDVTIVPAQTADVGVIEALLQREHLPLDGLREHPQHMFVARTGNRIVGCASMERHGDAALLRTVAVDAEYRHFGVGADLTRAALGFVERLGLSSVYLLTTTAERYFQRFGFETLDRTDVPTSVQRSTEFAHACPTSAFVMRKLLTFPT